MAINGSLGIIRVKEVPIVSVGETRSWFWVTGCSENSGSFHLQVLGTLFFQCHFSVSERDGGEVSSRPSGTLLQSSKPHQVTVDAELSCGAGHV